jgi:hypothetical protein
VREFETPLSDCGDHRGLLPGRRCRTGACL